MKKYSIKLWAISVLGAVLLAGCAGPAHIEKADNADLSQYKTFAWLHGEDGKLDQKSNLAESKIRSAITGELVKNGWKEVKTSPDIVVDYDILVERGSKEKQEAVYSQPYSRLLYNPYTRRYVTVYYPSRFLGYQSYEEIIKEGTITVTMIDAKTDKVVWQGWTTDEVNSHNITSKEIQRAVSSIFKKFDVAKR